MESNITSAGLNVHDSVIKHAVDDDNSIPISAISISTATVLADSAER